MNSTKYRFFLNPYNDYAFTKCPKCENKTKIRKFALVVVFEKPKIIFNINKICRFCQSCELIIAKKEEFKPLIESIGQNVDDMFIFGTLIRNDFWEIQKRKLSTKETLEKAFAFKDVWHFDLKPAGWYSNIKLSE